MGVIEKYLHEHFANLQDGDEAPSTAGDGLRILPDSQSEQLDEPFAKVNSVAANSPAQQAGLQAGDEIRNFGYVNRSNHDGLKKVAECVQGNEGVCCLCRPMIHLASSSNCASTEKHIHQSVSSRRGCSPPRAEINVDSEERLGWERNARLPHFASVVCLLGRGIFVDCNQRPRQYGIGDPSYSHRSIIGDIVTASPFQLPSSICMGR